MRKHILNLTIPVPIKRWYVEHASDVLNMYSISQLNIDTLLHQIES